MQDFYIQQRTAKILNSEEIQRWFLTVVMLAPEGVVATEDNTGSIVVGIQDNQYLYIVSLVRHLTADEANKIVEGYMRITDHDFEIESSNVYRADADLGHPFEMDIQMAQEVEKGIVPDPVHTNEMNAKALELTAQPPEPPAAKPAKASAESDSDK